ncbi:hypothetical protein JS756_26720 [Streptomyces actuosus]|uniref:Uncharacterized protein n=1 Tax=Streptomyces actuosus TaxID=1885 RepID=A0ABS2VWV8_STRAS|nr:hypothetical protein [Streptomyces actuosus]MBN0047637.1 hypothetical protein [Streptomyces actuosus]
MKCPSQECQSSNVQLLSHYVDSLPPGSPNRERYAKPAGPGRSFPGALVVIVLGIAALVSGHVWAGLLAVAGGGAWGWVLYRRYEAAESARAAWSNRRICLACTEQWVP